MVHPCTCMPTATNYKLREIERHAHAHSIATVSAVALGAGAYAWHCPYHCRALLQTPQCYFGVYRVSRNLVCMRRRSTVPPEYGGYNTGQEVLVGLREKDGMYLCHASNYVPLERYLASCIKEVTTMAN